MNKYNRDLIFTMLYTWVCRCHNLWKSYERGSGAAYDQLSTKKFLGNLLPYSRVENLKAWNCEPSAVQFQSAKTKCNNESKKTKKKKLSYFFHYFASQMFWHYLVWLGHLLQTAWTLCYMCAYNIEFLSY